MTYTVTIGILIALGVSWQNRVGYNHVNFVVEPCSCSSFRYDTVGIGPDMGEVKLSSRPSYQERGFPIFSSDVTL